MDKITLPIAEFPYGNKLSSKHPMHEKLLLLDVKSYFDNSFAIGYYDAIHDVFTLCMSPYVHAENYYYNERKVDDKYYNNYYCIMPAQFMCCVGPRFIKTFAMLNDVLDDMGDRNMFDDDIDKILETPHYAIPYLLCTKDNRIMVSNMSLFCEYGTQFSAFSPVNIKGDIRHINGAVDRDILRYAVNLLEWRGNHE